MSATTLDAARYGTVYVHLYGSGCPLDGRNFTRAQTRAKAGEKVCPTCRGMLIERRVTFALVAWRGDGRYQLSDAVATYAREAQAEAGASARYVADSASPYVVRTFTA